MHRWLSCTRRSQGSSRREEGGIVLSRACLHSLSLSRPLLQRLERLLLGVGIVLEPVLLFWFVVCVCELVNSVQLELCCKAHANTRDATRLSLVLSTHACTHQAPPGLYHLPHDLGLPLAELRRAGRYERGKMVRIDFAVKHIAQRGVHALHHAVVLSHFLVLRVETMRLVCVLGVWCVQVLSKKCFERGRRRRRQVCAAARPPATHLPAAFLDTLAA